ncbi:hypothetical protein F4780DRAFT_19723 [Xylariomycetidae sp. FL0641]|nr:hypothetical protein F4780DRAFT_19723 [Xylariomycetidae sp. FL0641]
MSLNYTAATALARVPMPFNFGLTWPRRECALADGCCQQTPITQEPPQPPHHVSHLSLSTRIFSRSQHAEQSQSTPSASKAANEFTNPFPPKQAPAALTKASASPRTLPPFAFVVPGASRHLRTVAMDSDTMGQTGNLADAPDASADGLAPPVDAQTCPVDPQKQEAQRIRDEIKKNTHQLDLGIQVLPDQLEPDVAKRIRNEKRVGLLDAQSNKLAAVVRTNDRLTPSGEFGNAKNLLPYTEDYVASSGDDVLGSYRNIVEFQNPAYGYLRLKIDHVYCGEMGDSKTRFATTEFTSRAILSTTAEIVVLSDSEYRKEVNLPPREESEAAVEADGPVDPFAAKADEPVIWDHLKLRCVVDLKKVMHYPDRNGMNALAEDNQVEEIQLWATILRERFSRQAGQIIVTVYFPFRSTEPKHFANKLKQQLAVDHDPYSQLYPGNDPCTFECLTSVLEPMHTKFFSPDPAVVFFENIKELTTRLAYAEAYETLLAEGLSNTGARVPRQTVLLPWRAECSDLYPQLFIGIVPIDPMPALLPGYNQPMKIFFQGVPFTMPRMPTESISPSVLRSQFVDEIMGAVEIGRDIYSRDIPMWSGMIFAVLDRYTAPPQDNDQSRQARKRFLMASALDLLPAPIKMDKEELKKLPKGVPRPRVGQEKHRPRVLAWVSRLQDDNADFFSMPQDAQTSCPEFLATRLEHPLETSLPDHVLLLIKSPKRAQWKPAYGPPRYVHIAPPVVQYDGLSIPNTVKLIKTAPPAKKVTAYLTRPWHHDTAEIALAGIAKCTLGADNLPHDLRAAYVAWIPNFDPEFLVKFNLLQLYPALQHLLDRVNGKAYAECAATDEAPPAAAPSPEITDSDYVTYDRGRIDEETSNAWLAAYHKLNEQQQAAVLQRKEDAPFGHVIISGGPGTGKSDTAEFLISVLMSLPTSIVVKSEFRRNVKERFTPSGSAETVAEESSNAPAVDTTGALGDEQPTYGTERTHRRRGAYYPQPAGDADFADEDLEVEVEPEQHDAGDANQVPAEGQNTGGFWGSNEDQDENAPRVPQASDGFDRALAVGQAPEQGDIVYVRNTVIVVCPNNAQCDDRAKSFHHRNPHMKVYRSTSENATIASHASAKSESPAPPGEGDVDALLAMELELARMKDVGEATFKRKPKAFLSDRSFGAAMLEVIAGDSDDAVLIRTAEKMRERDYRSFKSNHEERYLSTLRTIFRKLLAAADFIACTPAAAVAIAKLNCFAPTILWIDEPYTITEGLVLAVYHAFPDTLARIMTGDVKQGGPLVFSRNSHMSSNEETWFANQFGPQLQLSQVARMERSGAVEPFYLLVDYRSYGNAGRIARQLFRHNKGSEFFVHAKVPEIARVRQFFQTLGASSDQCGSTFLVSVEGMSYEHQRGTSYRNERHARVVVELVKAIFAANLCMELPTDTTEGTRVTVGVLTPYEQQNLTHKQHLAALSAAEYVPGLVDIRTKHNAQGSQWDIAIVDLTRSKRPGFISTTDNGAVLLSRGRLATIIVCNRQAWKSLGARSKKVGYLAEMWTYCERRKAILVIPEECDLTECQRCRKVHGQNQPSCAPSVCSHCRGPHHVRDCTGSPPGLTVTIPAGTQLGPVPAFLPGQSFEKALNPEYSRTLQGINGQRDTWQQSRRVERFHDRR